MEGAKEGADDQAADDETPDEGADDEGAEGEGGARPTERWVAIGVDDPSGAKPNAESSSWMDGAGCLAATPAARAPRRRVT